MTQTVLVVDDEPFILRSLAFVLERAGYDVLSGRNGDEALELLRNHRPQVCILDVMMPKRSGFEVCEIVKGDPGLRDTHVILLTAKGQEAARQRGKRAGADEYLTKPFSPSAIVERVRSALEEGTESPESGDAGVSEKSEAEAQ